MSKAVVGSVLLGLAALGLAGCGSEAEAPVQANPDAPAGVEASNGRMNLPAVAGNPAAVYFTLTNGGEKDYMIRSVNVAGAESAMMHQTTTWNLQPDMQEIFQMPVPAGGELVLEQGAMHVMAMNVSPDLSPGGETEVTVTFVGGDKISFPVAVRAAGDTGEAEGSAD